MSLVRSKLAAHEPGRVVVEVSSGHAPVTTVADALHRLVPIVDGVEVEAAPLPFAATLVQRLVMVSEFPIGSPVAGMPVRHEHAVPIQPRSHRESHGVLLRGRQQPGTGASPSGHGGQHGKLHRVVGLRRTLPDPALPRLSALAQSSFPLAAFTKVGLVHLDDPVQLVGSVEIRQKAMTPQKRRPVADSAPLRGLVQRQTIAQALLVELPLPSKTHVLQVGAGEGVEGATAAFRAASEANQAGSLAVAHDAFRSAVNADAGFVKLGFAGSKRFGNRPLVLSRHFPKTRFLGLRQPVVLAQPG